MRSTADGPPRPLGQGLSAGRSNANNNNNNNNNENSDNSGCQYALCALGVGLVALGIVMVVWSVVPADAARNSSTIVGGGGGDTGSKKTKVSWVAFVLVGCGVLMLLLSLGLGVRIKQLEQQRLREARNHGGEAGGEQQDGESAEEQAQRYAVPTYEEAVGSGRYPVRQSNHRPSTSQLPSYDDLLHVDGLEYEHEAPDTSNAEARQAPASTANYKPGKNSRKLLPINIRRIKSEKFHLKNNENSQPAAGFSIEPLTPPPQYEDKVPPL